MSLKMVKQNTSYVSKELNIELQDNSDIDFWNAPANCYFTVIEKSSQEDEDRIYFETFDKMITQTGNHNDDLFVEPMNSFLTTLKGRTFFETNKILALKILAKLSTISTSASFIKSSGLINWIEDNSNSDSPKVFLEAWKVLQNLKESENGLKVYLEGIYPFIPPWYKKQEPVADIILVHGIMGGAAWTWRQHDSEAGKPLLLHQERKKLLTECSCNNYELLNKRYTSIWPLDWLGSSIEKPLRIIAVDYPAFWWKWSRSHNDNYDLNNLSESFLLKLKAAGVGSRPIIWIAHSMGGLVVKRILELQHEASRCKQDKDSKHLDLLSATHAVIFLSVPHFGSPLASWTCYLAPFLRPSQYIYHMKADSPELIKAHQTFSEICKQNSVKVLTLNEGKPSQLIGNGLSFTFVPTKYGDPEIGEFHELDVCHLDICKPRTRSDRIFVLIEEFIRNVFENIPIS